jgi:hypothetical protein
MPIGDIVISMLEPSEFRAEVGDPTPFDPRRSKWSPVDGRNVTGSKYATLKATNPGQVITLPDLRGMFVRGLNTFDADAGPRQDGLNDPDTRAAGNTQIDMIVAHAHGLMVSQNEPATVYGVVAGDLGGADGRHNRGTATHGGPETRPRNVAVYYYIRINDQSGAA